ncbi:hypothetical protein_gp218 [Bacillus phage vB_BceM_WH1]|nr:hypothetical protein_gp218 [Bacillus phage vB_BceM_WH1]
MYTTFRQLIKDMGFDKTASEFTMILRDIEKLLDFKIPIYILGENHNKHWYYLIEHPDGYEGANHVVICALRNIKVYREKEKSPYSDWEDFKLLIDEDGDFTGDYTDFELMFKNYWWISSDKPLTLFHYENEAHVKKLNKETPFD